MQAQGTTPAACRRLAIVAVLVLVLGLALAHSWSAVTTSARGATAPVSSEWANVLHRGGAYAVFQDDVPAFQSAGLTLALTNKIPATHGLPDASGGAVKYIDPRATSLLWQYVGKYHCTQTAAPCPVSAADQQAVITGFKKELALQHRNPQVVGFYLLDDYVGNIPGLLAHLHDLIALDNATETVPRPTICGFGGSLDFWKPGLPVGTYERSNASLEHFTDLELLNFSPSVCDGVTLYIYALNHRASTSDYSMASLMPAMLSALRAHGWDATKQPLLGSPQTWAANPPTGAQVRTQTAAFCSFGAQSIIAFTWHNFPATGPNAVPELANSPDMRSGLTAGMQDCQRTWSAS